MEQAIHFRRDFQSVSYPYGLVHKLMDPVKLRTPRRQSVLDVSIIAVEICAELIEEQLIGTHSSQVAPVAGPDFSNLGVEV